MKALLSSVWRILLTFSICMLLLLAVFVSLGRELAPLLGDYRLQIEDAAREHGIELQIGRLEGAWSGLSPLIYARDLSLGEGATPLHLDQVMLQFDVLSSLWHGQIQVAHLQISGLQLELRENEQGRWQLDGLPQRSGEPAPLDIGKLLEKTSGLQQISINSSRLIIHPQQQDPIALTYVELSLRQDAEQRLDGRLVLPDGQPLEFSLETRLDRESWRDSTAQLYLNLPKSDWAAWLPTRLQQGWRVQHAELGGEFWFAWSAGALRRLSARVDAPQLIGQREGFEPFKLTDTAFELFYTRQARGEEWVVQGLRFQHVEQAFGPSYIGVQRRLAAAEVDEQWRVALDQLQIEPLRDLLGTLVRLPEKPQEIVQALHPQGTIRDLNLLWRPDADEDQRARFSASLEQISVGAYLGSPAVGNASGRIEGGLTEGQLLIDSHDFSLHFEKLFPEPWRYKRGQGTLNWQRQPGIFSLASPYVTLSGDVGEAAGDFMIRLYADPVLEDYMDLRVGLVNGNVLHTGYYLPSRSPAMSPVLVDWLESAVQGGVLTQGWFQFQGALMPGLAPVAHKLNLFAQVADAQLAFQPGFPPIKNVQAEVFLEGASVKVLASEAQLLNAQLSQVQIEIPHQLGQIPQMSIRGKVQADVQDALQFLQNAPTPAAPVFAGWRGQGDIDGTLQLELLLRKGAAAPHIQVDFSTTDTRLYLPQANLELQKLAGDFSYDTQKGLSAPQISAQVLGSAVKAKARALGEKGQAHSQIVASGQLAYPRLAGWLGLPAALPLAGTLPYELRLDLNGVDSLLQVDSSLKGLAVDLPRPFYKAADETLNSSFRMTFAGQERNYWGRYGERFSLAFAAPPTDLESGRGELRIGGEARLPIQPGLRLAGSLARLDWSEWQRVLNLEWKVSNAQAQKLFVGGRLDVALFEGFGLDINALKLELTQFGQGWALSMQSKALAGTLSFAQGNNSPLDLHLTHLNFPKPEKFTKADPESADVDALAQVDPRRLPAMDVRVDRLSWGGRPIGGWSFAIRPDEQGARFENVSLGLRGALLTGSGAWLYGDAGNSTRYSGRLAGSNLADVLSAWDFAPSVSSRRFRLDIDGHWQGSPAAVSLKSYSGVLGGNLWEGQLHELDGTASALRVFGLLNFNSLGRRLRLDFTDMFSKGLSYDRFKGVLTAQSGLYYTDGPLTIKGPSSDLEMTGQLDMRRQEVDAKVLVTLPVSNNLTLAALLAGAPAVGGALFLADKLLGDEVARFASVQYDVRGPLTEPDISFEKPFEKPQ